MAPAIPTGRTEPSDTQLVTQCRRGDGAAWEALVTRYQRLVISIPRKLKLNDDDASEVFDGVFAELWRSLPRLQHPETLRAWLVTVAKRRSLSQLQYRRRWMTLEELEAQNSRHLRDPAPVGDPLLLEAEREQTMREALATLSPRCRQVLEWLFFSDPAPAYEEIGKRLGLTGNHIGFIRARCLRRLRQELEARNTASVRT